MCTVLSGDVVLVPFPFTGQTASKKRPALIVSTVEPIAGREAGEVDETLRML